MARPRGNSTGTVRSTRLPLALDEWFEARLEAHPHRSPSEMLVELIHGGLRLRDAYMSIHRHALETRIETPAAYAEYRSCLHDTFGAAYVEHLDRWLEADGFAVTELA
jgi:hypothetical protein